MKRLFFSLQKKKAANFLYMQSPQKKKLAVSCNSHHP